MLSDPNLWVNRVVISASQRLAVNPLRLPQPQIVTAENNIGWLPYCPQRMDRAFERQRISAGFTNKLKPSDYFRRQMWAT